MIQSKFILDIVHLLAETSVNKSLLKSQIEVLKDENYKYTGSGIFFHFSSDNNILIFKLNDEIEVIDGVDVLSNELQISAYAMLFLKNGIIDYLEIFSRDNSYPKKELNEYNLKLST